MFYESAHSELPQTVNGGRPCPLTFRRARSRENAVGKRRFFAEAGYGRDICSAADADNPSLGLGRVDTDYSVNTSGMKTLVPYQATQNFPHRPATVCIKKMNPG